VPKLFFPGTGSRSPGSTFKLGGGVINIELDDSKLEFMNNLGKRNGN
jgi:hypothetical protein